MTDKEARPTGKRRQDAERRILVAAWTLMEREGVAAVSVREVARSVGLRQQSLTYYFPTKQDLLDALFADGFFDLERTFDLLPVPQNPVQGVVDVAVAFVDHCVARPASYHLMFQRTVPGFEPSEESHAVALGVLGVLVERLCAADVTDVADIAIVRSLMSGLAAEQIANEPGGRMFADQAERSIRIVLSALAASPAVTAARAPG